MDNLFVLQNLLPAVIVSLVCGLLIAGHYYYKNLYSYWRNKGVNGPKPLPVFGNFHTFLFCKNRLKLDLKWVKKYGRVYGVYQGMTPILVVADAEVMQQICIKDFDAWPNHTFDDFGNKYGRHFLIALRDEKWKQVRAMMTPTFTSGKIKRMFRFLDGCANDLVDCFREQLPVDATNQRETIVNVKEIYNLFTMDAITTCCYGLKLERAAGSANLKTAASRNDFVRMAMQLFKPEYLRLLIGITLPKPFLKAVGYQRSSEAKSQPLAHSVAQMIARRRQTSSDKKFDDYLQLLIDAKLEDEVELNEMDLEENHHAGLTKESILADQKKMLDELNSKSSIGVKVALDNEQILGNAMFLLMVGLETTGTLLAHTSYALAFHQEIQAKLHEELLKIVEYNEDKTRVSFSYDALTSCKYLDAVLSETLRYLSPVFTIDRQSTSDYRIEKYNVDLPAGSRVLLAYYALHNDPEYWEEPEKFNPDRFLPENKDKIVPGSYSPFGLGPRHCIGMRFSLTEAKLALAKVLINFKFEPATNTKFPPEPKKPTIVLHNINSPLVKLVPRTKVETQI